MISNASYIQIELEESSTWQIEPIAGLKQAKTSLLLKKVGESLLKAKLRKTLSLQPEKSCFYEDHLINSTDQLSKPTNELKFDLISTYHPFHMQLNLSQVTIFKSLLEDLKRSKETADADNLEPVRVTAALNVFYCVDNTASLSTRNSLANTSDMSQGVVSGNPMLLRKYFMRRVDISFVLGYTKLKSSAAITSFIEFEMPINEQDASLEASDVIPLSFKSKSKFFLPNDFESLI